MIFDLQKFGEGDNTADTADNTADNNTADNNTADNNTADNNTADNKADDVQAKIDAAIAKALEQWNAELKKRDDLSKLSEDERIKAELDNTRKELENQRLAFEKEKIRYEATKVLAQRNLPVEFTEYLIDEDNTKTLARITTFEKKYKKAVEDAVTEKLKGKPPQVSGNNADSNDTSSFMKTILANQIKY